ncbi:MAG TPA: hypothetical protein VEI02_06940, partial [Planctomycetota bacterium]|nr:hypothetical protein [Planctomycetota bacterium]
VYESTKGEGAKLNSMWALAKYGDPKGLEDCLAFLKDEKSGAVRHNLGMGFLMLNTAAVLPLADAYVETFKSRPDVMNQAVEYYKNLRSNDGRIRLQAIANDASQPQSVRDAALKALNS